MKISAEAKKLYDLLPYKCWMAKSKLAKAVGCRAARIKNLKDELEAAGLIKILFRRNGNRANPSHEIIKISKNGNPICKHIFKLFSLGEWWWLDRNQQIECYLNSGWEILPFAPRAKRPVESFSMIDWRRTTPAAKMDYFFNNPDLNVGLAVCSHMTVVDVDAKRNSWIEHKNFRETLTVSTPRGFHFYFRKDPVVTTTAKILPDIDTRCGGSFVVLPPSVHASNEPYRWENITLPNRLPIEFRREWREREFKARKRMGDFALPSVIEIGARNDTLWRYGRGLRAKGKNFNEIEAALVECNHNNCLPPLSKAEMESLVKKCLATPQQTVFSDLINNIYKPANL